jgi:hypothetical protein
VVLHEDVAVLRDAGGAGVSEKLGELATEAGGGELDVFDGGFGHDLGSVLGEGRVGDDALIASLGAVLLAGCFKRVITRSCKRARSSSGRRRRKWRF